MEKDQYSAELTRLQKTVAYHTQRLAELEVQLESISRSLLEPGIGYRRLKKSWDNTNEDRNFSVEQLSACKEKIALMERICNTTEYI